MYGSYSEADSQDRDGSECSTYPSSIGRPGGGILLARRWGNRTDVQPIRMKLICDEENEEENSDGPLERRHFTETEIGSQEELDTEVNDEEEDDQSYNSIEVSHDSHHEKGSLAGSVSKQRHHFTEATYPTSRTNRAGVYNAFSSFAVPLLEGSNEATPWKPTLLKTEEKRGIAEKVSESMLMKTPFPERSVTKDNSNLWGDSGIGLMATQCLNGSNRCSARGLFTPSYPKSISSDLCEVLPGFMALQNKLPNLNEVNDFRKPTENISTPLLAKSKAGANQQLQGEETPMKSIPLESTDIMELVKIHKSEKKGVRYNTSIENMFNEANKENFSYRMQCELGSSQGQERKEKEEIKLLRSLSHTSVLKAENGKIVTPSKEDRPSSAKSLSNLFHPNQNSATKVNQHSSRIPTPIRSHTPQKLNPQTPVPTTNSKMETSCVEMLDLQIPMKYSYSPHKDVTHEQKASDLNTVPKPFASFSSGHPNPSLGNHLIPQTDKEPATLKHDVSKPCSNQRSPPIQQQYPLIASNSMAEQGVCLPTNTHHEVHSNGLQPCTKTSTFAFTDIALNKQEKPSCIFQSATKSLEPQGNSLQRLSANSVVTIEPTPVFAVPGISQKPFSLRAPSFIPPQSKNDPNYDPKFPCAKSCAPSSLAVATSQINSNHFRLPSSHPLPHLSVESTATSHLPLVEGHKQPSQAQNAKVNYFPVNSQPFDRQHVHPNVLIMGSTLANTQQIPYGSEAFIQSRGHALSSIQQVNCVNSSNQPLVSCDSGKCPVVQNPTNLVVIPTSAATQPVENPQSDAKKLRIPPEVEPQPVRKVISSVRPVSVQTNRKILVVNKKKYEVLRLLGKGASSKVYDVLDCQTNRCVAVKRVILRQGDASVEGYLKEVELLNQLQGSECIIRLLDSEICLEMEYKVLYMVLERGEMDLSTSIKLMSLSGNQPMPGPGHPGGKIPTVTVIYYWVSMLNAVDEIHQKGIVHSDLKPANFLLVGGKVKLIDFGIATAVQVDVTSVVKDDPAGTPNYMSPEAIGLTVSGSPNSQVMFNNPKASYKSDVWSLGCILYSLVYGRSPFQHIMNERMKLDAICNPKYAIPFPSNSIVHLPLLRAMKRCLVRNYKERASIAELKSIDYLCGNELDEESWNSWKAMASEKILNALSPDCKMQAIKVIQEVFQSPPVKRTHI